MTSKQSKLYAFAETLSHQLNQIETLMETHKDLHKDMVKLSNKLRETHKEIEEILNKEFL